MFENKRVLITGASSGIGASLAREFHHHGAEVILLARRLDRLRDLAAELCRIRPDSGIALQGDVAVDGSLERALENIGRLDVVVANAGFGVVGRADELSLEDYRRQFEVNVFGVLRTFYATIDSLKQSRGRFAVVGSVNGYLSLPGNSPYSMSKFSVRAFCDSIAGELRHDGVSVTHVAPGFVESEIRHVNNRGKLIEGSRDRVPSWLQMPSDAAARDIVRGIYRHRREVRVTRHAKAVIWLERHLPAVVHFAIGQMKISARSEARGK